MGFNFNGSQANVVITGGLTFAKNTATIIYGEAINAASTTMGTVGAGKVWRILNIALTVYSSSATSTQCSCNFNDVVKVMLTNAGTATMVQNNSVTMTWDYSACPVLTAGQTVKVVNSGNSSFADCSVSYVEESA